VWGNLDLNRLLLCSEVTFSGSTDAFGKLRFDYGLLDRDNNDLQPQYRQDKTKQDKTTLRWNGVCMWIRILQMFLEQ